MWRSVENSDSTKPAEIDTTTSGSVVYIRKNFMEVPSVDMNGEEDGSHWKYDEMTVLKSEWPTYEQTMKNASNIDYIAMMTDLELEEV